jgi:hypothetical protein
LRFVHQSECSPARLEYKRRFMAVLDEYRGESDRHRRGQIWRSLFQT